MGQFSSRLGQVLTIYMSQRWWLLALSVVAIPYFLQVGYLAFASDPPRIIDDGLPLVLLPALTVPMYLVPVSKPQFAHPRAALMPGFHAPHLAIPATVLFTLLVALPVLVAAWTGGDPIGLSAFACVAAVPILWGMHTITGKHTLRTFGLLLAPVPIIFWAAGEHAVSAWWVLPNRDLIAVRLSIVVVGLAASAAWLWRLTQLREEMEEYVNPFVWPANKKSRIGGNTNCRPVPREFVRLAGVAYDRWLGRLKDFDTDSFRGRMRLLEFGNSAWPPLLSALAFGAYFLLLEIFLGVVMPRSMRGTQHALLAFLLLLSLCVMPWTRFKIRRLQMVGELMLPMTRKQLIDCLFATVARQVAAQWIAGCAVALPIVALFPCESTTLRAVGTLLLFATSIQVIVFGLGAYVAAWSSRELQIVAMWVLGGFLFVLCMVLIFSLPDPWVRLVTDLGMVPIFLLTLLQLCVGLAIIKMAHRKWLNLES